MHHAAVVQEVSVGILIVFWEILFNFKSVVTDINSS